MKTNHKLKMTRQNLDFKVKSPLLDLAYHGDADALLKIGKQAFSENRLGLAKNFFRLADEYRNQKAAVYFKEVS